MLDLCPTKCFERKVTLYQLLEGKRKIRNGSRWGFYSLMQIFHWIQSPACLAQSHPSCDFVCATLRDLIQVLTDRLWKISIWSCQFLTEIKIADIPHWKVKRFENNIHKQRRATATYHSSKEQPRDSQSRKKGGSSENQEKWRKQWLGDWL